MNEHERIAWLLSRPSDSPHLTLANGDDAATVNAPSGAVISVDAQVEGTHFKRSFADWATLGRRAVVAALSDLAAMGASPRAVFSSLVLPAEFVEDDFHSLTRGIARGAEESGVVVAGGNLSGGPCVMIDTTVVGEAPKGVVTRSGAAPGDGLFVTGVLGAAALGLAALLAEREDTSLRPYIDAWRAPAVDFTFASTLKEHASAAIDISDGLLQDLSHLCRASGVSAELDELSLAPSDGFRAAAEKLGRDPRELVLSGGESYFLLFASPQPIDGATRIGRIVESASAPVFNVRGDVLQAPGFDHFT
ncbi:MAG: thiamine-phosphate kinase [Polyangiales bacterium]